MRCSPRLIGILVLAVMTGCSRSAPIANVSPAVSPTSSQASPEPSLQPSLQPSAPSPIPVGGSPTPAVFPTPTDVGVPVPRSNATWVFDGKTDKFLLFGGNYTTGNYNEFPQALGDTWTWDGANWTQLDSSANAPVARYAASAIYDPVRAVVLLHGGTGQSSGLSINDTWTWDGIRWSQLGLAQSPPSVLPLALQPMCWDAARAQGVLFDRTGGLYEPSPDRTWSWDGTNWKQVPTSSAPAGNQGYGWLAYDPGRKQTLFFGQTNSGPVTWTFDGTTWSHVAGNVGTTSTTFSMATDDANSDIVLFGENGDTWTWDGSTWTPKNPAHSPGARRGAALTYDSVRKIVVLFGGATGTAASLKQHNDIWTWNGSDWSKVIGN